MQNTLFYYGDNLPVLLIAGVAILASIFLFRRWRGRIARSRDASPRSASTSPTIISEKDAYLAFLIDTKHDRYRRGTVIGKGLNFDEDNLEGMDLSYAHLEACSFVNAWLKNADFTDGHFTDVIFHRAHLVGAKLTHAQFTRVDFEYATFYKNDLSQVHLTATNFTGATLVGVNLSQVHLTDTDLTGAELLVADLRGAFLPGEIERARFPNADLRFAHFDSSAQLMRHDLPGAKYNFFTEWPTISPLAPLPQWPIFAPGLSLPSLSLPIKNIPLDADAISADGLGPNPFFVHRSSWPRCQLMRWETLDKAAVRFGVAWERKAHIKTTTKAKFDKIIATPDAIDTDKVITNYIKPSVDILYQRVAWRYMNYRFMFKDVLESRPDVGELIQEYYAAALDLLTLAEYTQGAFLRDDFLHVLTEGPDKPEFESPIEELFWTEWQKQGGASTVELLYQYKVPEANYRIDFVHLPKKLAIELDGYEYHSSKEQFTADRKRQRELESGGWRFIRFSGSEVVRDVSACFREVCAFVDSAT